MSANTPLVCALIVSLFTAYCDDDNGPPGGGGNTGGSGGSSGSGAGTNGASGTPADGGAGTSGAAGSSAGTSGASGAAGSSADAGDGSAGTDAGATNVVGTSGGMVSHGAGDITLTIPPGALLGDTQFTFAPVASMSGLPSELVFVEGHRIDWTAAGFAAGAKVTARIRLPETQPLTESDDLLAQSFPPWCVVVQCPDGSLVRNECRVVTGGALDEEIAPICPSGNPPAIGGPGSVTLIVANTAPGVFPTITTQPGSLSVSAGGPAVFSVAASGIAPLSYQWRRDGTNISGATNANYFLDPVQLADNGAKFSVRISNQAGQVISNEAVLTVGPPRTPFWNTVTPQNAFTAGVDLPQVGSLAGGGADFVVWNDNDRLRGASSWEAINNLAEPMRGRPKLLTGGNLISAFIVFVDDTPTSGCGEFTGNRLSALAVRAGSPRSNRFTLYESAGDCIAQFSAGLIDTGIAFALVEQTTGQLKVGSGSAFWDTAGAGSWSYTAGTLSAFNPGAACSTGTFLLDQGLMGRRQAFSGPSGPATTAVLSWVANDNLCAATLTGGVWSSGSVVFDRAVNDFALGVSQAVSAIDGAGNALVVASRVEDPALTPPTFEMTAAFRSAAGGAWQVQALDRSAGIALPSATITSRGDTLVAWRPDLSAPPTSVFVARRTAAGVWQPTERISSATAADTRYPRICTDSAGNAVAVYQEKSGAADPFQVWARFWSGGAWSAPGRAQNNANEGRFADCVPHQSGDFLRDGVFIAWRETDPSDSTKFRIVTAR
jgi:hypothetical protein